MSRLIEQRDRSKRSGRRATAALALGVLLVVAVSWRATDSAAQEPEPASGATDSQVAQAESPSLLDWVPADATGALIVPNLQQLSDRIALINTRLGIDQAALADLLMLLQEATGARAGVREDGPLVLYTGSIATMGPGGSPAVFALVPVSDYAAFLGNYGAAAGRVSVLLLPGSAMPFYSRQVGDFALVGFDDAQVTSAELPPPASLAATAGSLANDVLGRSDATLLVNVAALAPMLRPMLASAWDVMELNFSGAPGTNPESLESTLAMLRLYRLAFDALLRDTQLAAVGLDLSDTAVGFTASAQFREGTPLSRMFAEGAPAGDILARVPDRPYLFAVAGNLVGIDVDAFMTALSAAFPTDAGGFATIMSQATALMRDVNSFAGVWYVPELAAGEVEPNRLFDFVTLYRVTDGTAFLDAMRGYMEGMNGVAIPMGPVATETGEMVPGQATYTSRYEVGALEIDSLRVDRFEMQVTMPPELLEQLDAMGPWGSMLGLSGYSGLIAARGQDVLMATSDDEASFRAAFGGLESTGGLGARAGIGEVRAMATATDSAFEMFVDVGGIVGLVRSFSGTEASPTVPSIPADLLPIGAFGDIRDHGILSRMVVPLSTARFLRDLIVNAGGPSSEPI